MADIELVIKIDEDDYNFLKKQVADGIINPLKTCIANGTPLPKGHGDLIDISDIEWAKHREERNYIDYEVIDWDDIVNAPTIIEADTESEEQA